MNGLPIVGVMGSGSVPYPERSEPVGRMLASLPVHLLTGGGGGVMYAASRAFHETQGRRGLVIGVVPGVTDGRIVVPPEGYPNPWVEIPIRTHLTLSGARGEEPLSRNHINVLTADIVVLLPGSAGSVTEARLAVRYGRPVIAFIVTDQELPGLPGEIERTDNLDRVREFVLTEIARLRPDLNPIG